MPVFFIRTRIMPLLARLSNRLPGWLYWRILWSANQKFLIGAAAVILDERREVLLFRHTFRPAGLEWGLPGGWLERGESIQQALEREIYEESRLQVQVFTPLAVSAARAVPRLDVVFLGRPAGGSFQPSNEVSEARFFPASGLPRLLPIHEHLIHSAIRRLIPQSAGAAWWNEPCAAIQISGEMDDHRNQTS